MIVAVHQPNFFPWLGYFNKIRRADVFVMLDDAQQSKTGGTWANRVKIADARGEKWLTAPVERNFSGVRQIRDIRFAGGDWRERLIAQLAGAYRRCDHFAQSMGLLEPLLRLSESNLLSYNMQVITTLCRALKLGTDKFVLASTCHAASTGTGRLIELTRAVGGTHYLSGSGAGGYQEAELFVNSGVELVYQSYRAEPYPQLGRDDFLGGLSVIDALVNRGVDGVAQLIDAEAAGPLPSA